MSATIPAGQRLVLEADGASVEVAAAEGGRIASFRVGGRELLVTTGPDAIHWGVFPMVPFAGRVRGGTFEFGGRQVRLPLNMPPNAIHGTVHERAWTVVDERSIEIDLGPDWPFAGRVVQRFDLRPGQLDVSLELDAAEPMPAALGWHPWFRRRIDGLAGEAPPGDPSSVEVELALEADVMFERDPDGISSRRRVRPTVPPWDDCFTAVRAGPTLAWPGGPTLHLSSSCPFWVVYDELPWAMCVEPQTAPPNDLNHEPTVVVPGRPLGATMTWRWSPVTGGPGATVHAEGVRAG